LTQTKLGRYCDKLIEAGWLAALIVVPLFFNIYSSRVFEPDKITLLRSLVILMIVAWIVGKVEAWQWADEKTQEAQTPAGPGLWARIRAMPLVLPTLLMVLAYLISVAFSRTPGISWKGSYVRLQGVSAAFSYIVIFFLMLERLRSREQLERAIQTIILTSVAPSLYGILQHYGLDPLPWAGEVVERVSSSMGNAIFIAAYLLMVFFVTLYKALQVFERLASSKDESNLRDAVLGGVYLFIMAIQLIAIFFTQSRGPWLGLLGGLYAFVLILLVSLRQSAGGEQRVTASDLLRGCGVGVGALLVGGLLAWVSIAKIGSPLLGLALLAAVAILTYAILILTRKGLRWLWVSWIVQTLLVAAFLVVFNLPQTPLESLRETPYIGRLGQVFETEGGTGKVRVLIWEGAVEMITASPLRALVGYGPESMYVTYEPFYPPDLAHYEARNRTPDRSHNQTFDSLAATGLLGFLAYMFVFSSVFYYGLRWLGLIRSDRERNLFLGFIIGGAAAGALLAWLVTGGLAFVGVSLPAGFIGGLVLYLVVAAMKPTAMAESALHGGNRMLVAALMAAILGHFIEIHFGFVIAATGTYFWALAALFVLVGSGRIREISLAEIARPLQQVRQDMTRKQKRKKRPPTPAHRAAQKTESKRWMIFLSYTMIVVIILTTVAFDFTSNQMRLTSIPSIIWESFTTVDALTAQPRASMGMVMLLLLTTLVGGAIAFYEAFRAETEPPKSGWYLRAALVFVLAVILIPLAVAAAKAGLVQVGKPVWDIIARWYLAFFPLVLLLGLALYRPGTTSARVLRKETSWVYVLLTVAAGFVIWNANGVLVKADIIYQQGYMLEQDYMKNAGSLQTDQRLQVLSRVMDMYENAIQYAPSEDFYYLAMARVYQQMVPLVEDPQQKETLLKEGIATVEKARAIYPLNVDHTANMGRFYRTWAQEISDPTEKLEKLQLASDYYAQAIQLSPNKAHLYNEWALTYYLMGDYENARQKLEKSLSLDAEYDQTYLLLGQLYTQTGDWALAEEMYRKAVELNPNAVESLSMLGYVLDQQGKITEAIAQNLSVLQLSPQDYVTVRNLSVLYNKVNDYSQALAYAQLALSIAPEADKAGLQQFVEQLQALVSQK
jgi:tetratricopeptide (TPR) repeat protein